MQPAVVVATNFNGLPNDVAGFAPEVVDNVIPYVRGHYNVSAKAADTAITGLSAGGARIINVLFRYTSSFGYVSVQSPRPDAAGTPGAVPPLGDPLYGNLKSLLGLQVGAGLQDACCNANAALLDSRLTAEGIPHFGSWPNGGHEWYVWRQMLHDFAGGVAFRATSTTVGVSGTSVTAMVTPGSTEPAAPTGSVQFAAGGAPLGAPVPVSGGKATLSVPSTAGAAEITATYSGDAFYNASKGSAAYAASSGNGTVGGSVPATLSLTLGTPAEFGAFTPGKDATYTASANATVTSTAGDATLTTDGGSLSNGAFTLSEPLTVSFSKSSWSAPVSNDAVTIGFSQHIGATEPLRTGAYSKTLTFTLSTTTP